MASYDSDLYNVEKAINYSIEGNKVDPSKLQYYQRNMAEDGRFPFEIAVNLLREYSIVVVNYRKKQYLGIRQYKGLQSEIIIKQLE